MSFLLDMGVCFHHYHSDMTRSFGFGSVDEEVKKVYSLVYEAKKRESKRLEKGKKAKEIDAVARTFLDGSGKGEFFIHSLGHGIGLETHEMPYLRKNREEIIPADCVVTIEPGLYFANRFGIRIEDMLLVKEEGCENLTPKLDSNKILLI